MKHLSDGVKTARLDLEHLIEQNKDPLDPSLIHARGHLSTLERQVLEAEISLIFARRLLAAINGTDQNMDGLYAVIEKTAFALNRARVAKRSDDYLVALCFDQ